MCTNPGRLDSLRTSALFWCEEHDQPDHAVPKHHTCGIDSVISESQCKHGAARWQYELGIFSILNKKQPNYSEYTDEDEGEEARPNSADKNCHTGTESVVGQQ